MMERSKTTILVRHLPQELTHQETIDLLCHFGAERVRQMGNKGSMKHTAFAQFDSEEIADRGLRRLHQLEVLGCRLVAEYAKFDEMDDIPSEDRNNEKVSKTKSTQKDSTNKEKGSGVKRKVEIPRNEDPFLSRHDIPYPRKPTLFYRYPPPTVSTLTNIANALASHPKFYTQVLHLMNKMNLPCPFGTVTPSPPLALDSSYKSMYGDRRMMNDNTVDNVGEIEDVEMEDEESEIESDEDGGGAPSGKEKTISMTTRKRPRKRMRLVKPDMSMIMKPIHIPKPNEIFENVDERKSSQIVFNIAGTESKTSGREVRKDATRVTSGKGTGVEVIEGGFGKVEPVHKPEVTINVQKTDVEYKLDPANFLSIDKVTSGRLKPNQMKEFSVFKKYSKGEPTCRLYIKNLTKQATEQDIVNLFGNFINWDTNNAVDTFDVRLMKEGRMKGQCFVTLPDENSAIRIVEDCNTYVLNSKPIVIQFARSARAKEVDKPVE